jgi:hypothetical protein
MKGGLYSPPFFFFKTSTTFKKETIIMTFGEQQP